MLPLSTKVSVVISYCSLDRGFLRPMLEESAKFSKDIVVVAFDHLFNGEPEDLASLEETASRFADVRIHVHPWSSDHAPRHFHNMARWQGVTRAREPWVLFLDGDEVPEGEPFGRFLREVKEHDAYAFACHWYFREPIYRARFAAQCGLLIKTELVDEPSMFSEQERWAFCQRDDIRVRQRVTRDGKPFLHHFSWVRGKEASLKKVGSWGHRDELARVHCFKKRTHGTWEDIIEHEFSAPFRGTEEIHGFDYDIVPNRFSIEPI